MKASEIHEAAARVAKTTHADAARSALNKLFDCMQSLDIVKQDIDRMDSSMHRGFAAQSVVTADEAIVGAFEILCSLREVELDR
tara:strand:- start:5596 stop:5847 length:252 start_codon:yes stop_codon:yes gene_type:complete